MQTLFKLTRLSRDSRKVNLRPTVAESLESRRLLAVNPSWFEVTPAYEAPILSLPADANGDRTVELGDFGILKENFGLAADQASGDFDGDGLVTIGDFGILKQSFGQTLEYSDFNWQGQTVNKIDNWWVAEIDPSVAESVVNPSELQSFLGPYGIEVLRGLGQVGRVLVRTESDDPIEVAAAFAASEVVVSYEPDVVLKADFVPNDPAYASMWNLRRIKAPDAWDITMGNRDIVVAVIDSGMTYGHPDLTGQVWNNPSEEPGNSLDDDSNGLTDDFAGYDFLNNNSFPLDDFGHGTHVAGTIAAVDNSTGTIGVSPDTSILPIKVMGADGLAPLTAVTAGVNYATQIKNSGANLRVINLSLGEDEIVSSSSAVTALIDAIREAGESDILVVASAGNDAMDTDVVPHFPSSLDLENIISVAATDDLDELSTFSNFGATSVDIGAPGDEILSTVPAEANFYETRSGTSMAAAHVSGAAALLWSVVPQARAVEVKHQILQSARYLSDLDGRVVSDGILDLDAALEGWGGRVGLRPHFYMPPDASPADEDFDTNGPEVELTATLRISDDRRRLETRVFMEAEETGSDSTRAAGTSDWETAYVAPDGQTIEDVFSPLTSSQSYTDTGFDADILRMPLGDLVDHYEVVGDTDGEDAGFKTGVRVHFRTVEIRLRLSPELNLATDHVCSISLDELYWEPPLVRGDEDFGEQGPLMHAFVELRSNGGEVEGRVYLHAQEWAGRLPRADHTTFDGWSPWQTIYTPGVIFSQIPIIQGSMQSQRVFFDTDNEIDVLAGDRLVESYEFHGSDDGSDLPSVTIRFNDILVQREQCGGGDAVSDVNLRPHFLRPIKAPGSVGDNDFDTDGNGDGIGNGVNIQIRTEIRINPDHGKTLETRVEMRATETQTDEDGVVTGHGDGTTAFEVSPWETAFAAPAGHRILAFRSTSTSDEFTSRVHEFTFFDDDHFMDIFDDEFDPALFGPDSLVSALQIIGDTGSHSEDIEGNDVEEHTSVRVFFNPVSVRLEAAPIGETIVARVRGFTFTEPPLVRGDSEFGGTARVEGTAFRSKLRVELTPFIQYQVVEGDVQVRTYAFFQERFGATALSDRASDYTAFAEWSDWTSLDIIGDIPVGKRIRRILAPMSGILRPIFFGDELFCSIYTHVCREDWNAADRVGNAEYTFNADGGNGFHDVPNIRTRAGGVYSVIAELEDQPGSDESDSYGAVLALAPAVVGDLNFDGQTDVDDITTLCEVGRGQFEANEADLDFDGLVDQTDLRILINEVFNTEMGDANLDGVFDSSDLIRVFQAGQYEDARRHNSTWSNGDWNCDGEFETDDLIVAFQAGGYIHAAKRDSDEHRGAIDDQFENDDDVYEPTERKGLFKSQPSILRRRVDLSFGETRSGQRWNDLNEIQVAEIDRHFSEPISLKSSEQSFDREPKGDCRERLGCI